MPSSRAMLSMMCLLAVVALLFPAALSMPELISMPTDQPSHQPVVSIADGLALDHYAESCPDVRDIVRTAVQEAFQEDTTIAAGLLRLFFHDCFPNGCDASILLTIFREHEQRMLPNRFLRRSAFDFIEETRSKVHAACGRTVSCADITVLATHDAVVASGGKPYHVPLGRLDSLEPALRSAVHEIPSPTFKIDNLIAAFSSRSLDEKDLVVLSGAHTIGGARCASISDRFPEDTEFVRKMRINCTSSHDPNMLQDLDVTTPTEFDNKYYTNLKDGKGVLTSDVQLLLNERTREHVDGFAGDEWWFWNQFGNSMSKLGMLQGPQGNVGNIRRSCMSSFGSA